MTTPTRGMTTLEAVVNISEGRDPRVLHLLKQSAGTALLDTHVDPDHNRSVFTMAGSVADLDGSSDLEDAVKQLASVAVEHLDVRTHAGVHPRLGVVDVVPFVPLAFRHRRERVSGAHLPGGAHRRLSEARLVAAPTLDPAAQARDRFSKWAGSVLGVPCFSYGPIDRNEHRSLPDIRRSAFSTLQPESGPSQPHPSAGACAVGARPLLIAYNVWIRGVDPTKARSVAAAVRGPGVRALALPMHREPGAVQVSCNLVDPFTTGPAHVHDRIARLVENHGGSVLRCELVGLLPAGVLDAIPPSRWSELDLRPESTIEARLEDRGFPVG